MTAMQPTPPPPGAGATPRLGPPPKQGLYDPWFEHDACGVGFVVNIKGRKSHEIVRQGLQVLLNLTHRGACGAEVNTGDGAGILLQMPDKFLRKAARQVGIQLPPFGQYGVGMIFLPPDPLQRRNCERLFEVIAAEEGQEVLGWRTVPTDNSMLGETARASEPYMRQVFLRRSPDLADDMAFERKLYVIRKRAVTEIRNSGLKGSHYWYSASLSYKTIVYKGMLMPDQLPRYYADLVDPDLESALALVHSRFSTNTFPSWSAASRTATWMHNGEINTLRGNINWMHARQAMFQSELFGDDLKKILPIINTDGSDSAMFDNCLELLVLAGRSLPHAMMMMIPEPWQNHESMSDEKKAFYEYHACLMEPWDGPASIAFTDGVRIGAVLDRNGLRPSRYYVTRDDLVIMASEVGVLDIPPDRVIQKGRLQPGRMFLVDTEEGRIVSDEEIKRSIATAHPYREWLNRHMIELSHLPEPTAVPEPDHRTVLQRQIAFGYTFEDLRLLWLPMARDGVEPWARWATTRRWRRSPTSRLLYDYFKQLFAQVTNPPIDCIREEIVTASGGNLGAGGQPAQSPARAAAGASTSKTPILTNEELAKLRQVNQVGFKPFTLPILFNPREGGVGLDARHGRALRPRRQGHRRGRQHPHPLRPRRGRGQRAHPGPAGDLRPPPPPHPHRHPHPGGPGARVGRAARGAPLRPAHRLRVPAPSTPTWPSRRSMT
jgi:glutamate synthase (ferredoxin)